MIEHREVIIAQLENQESPILALLGNHLFSFLAPTSPLSFSSIIFTLFKISLLYLLLLPEESAITLYSRRFLVLFLGNYLRTLISSGLQHIDNISNGI